MDPWVEDWIKEQKNAGVKCLEIKQRGTKYYAYHSTTHWDKNLKKAIKTSKYLGRLDSEKGLIKSRERNDNQRIEQPSRDVRNVTEYGNSVLLQEAMKDLRPLLMEAFPKNWEEIYALSKVRVAGNVPLKRAESAWDKYYNIELINPNLNPKNLSKMLHSVGINREGQRVVFKRLLDQSEQLVYDLSCVFSRSVSISMAEKGYNKNRIHVPQINIVLLCSADTGLPTMIRSLPGSVKDIKTLGNSILELDIRGKILILDRGFFSEEIFIFLEKLDMSYLIPARRNSSYYETRIHLNSHFRYHKRLIRSGYKKEGSKHLYLFEDQVLMLEERDTLYDKLDAGNITKSELHEEMKKSGRILILSNRKMPAQDAYELFKKRDGVEKLFDTYKSTLFADRLYLQDDESVFGHVFIAFLSLYAHCKIEIILKKAELNKKLTPYDLLFEFSKVYYINFGESGKLMEVPKKIRDIEAKLKINLFPT